MLPLGVHKDIPIEDYHAQHSEEEHFFSSSQLKTMLQDPEVFYRKYISCEEEKESNSAFDIGHYFHTAILEPHLLDNDFAVFKGKIRRGNAWEDFLKQNKGKIPLTLLDLEKGKLLVKAVKGSPIAMKMLQGGSPEVSCMTELFVDLSESEIYAKKEGWKRLSHIGWVDCEEPIDFGLVSIKLKVRADYIVEGKYILDLKSSSSNVKNESDMRHTTSKYSYDLSASLYLDLFNLWMDEPMSTFLWVYASKSTGTSKTWASTEKILRVGRAKWKKAVIELAKYKADKWEFVDELGWLTPVGYDLEWIKD